jgi:glycosyltransferase involved in cell wall biosynthesis
VLPRLLYLGDVPVESSYHGSTLLFRLLEHYPAARLHIIEGNLFPARTDRRLRDVRHATLSVGRSRVLNSRLHHAYSRWLFFRAAARATQIPKLLGPFSPDAVLTVGHGYSWLTAAAFARQAAVPLHLIVHDDFPRGVSPGLHDSVDRAFGDTYRLATTRLCTSPFMTEEYLQRYGVSGTLLLPYRSADARRFPGPSERIRSEQRTLTVAFAGTVNSAGYADLLRDLAGALLSRDGRLLIYGPMSREHAARIGLDLPNVVLGGLLAPDDLIPRLRQEADVLFAPMSFAPEERSNMQMAFPTKLTDYTAAGLPLLIVGPDYCSAVRWGAGVAEVVTDPSALGAALDRLAEPGHRVGLAEAALKAGDRDFSAATATAIFQRALLAPVC